MIQHQLELEKLKPLPWTVIVDPAVATGLKKKRQSYKYKVYGKHILHVLKGILKVLYPLTVWWAVVYMRQTTQYPEKNKFSFILTGKLPSAHVKRPLKNVPNVFRRVIVGWKFRSLYQRNIFEIHFIKIFSRGLFLWIWRAVHRNHIIGTIWLFLKRVTTCAFKKLMYVWSFIFSHPMDLVMGSLFNRLQTHLKSY